MIHFCCPIFQISIHTYNLYSTDWGHYGGTIESGFLLKDLSCYTLTPTLEIKGGLCCICKHNSDDFRHMTLAHFCYYKWPQVLPWVRQDGAYHSWWKQVCTNSVTSTWTICLWSILGQMSMRGWNSSGHAVTLHAPRTVTVLYCPVATKQTTL